MSWRHGPPSSKPTVDPELLSKLSEAIAGAKTGDRSAYETRARRDLRDVTGGGRSSSNRKAHQQEQQTHLQRPVGPGTSTGPGTGPSSSTPQQRSQLDKLRALAAAQANEENIKLKAELYDRTRKGTLVFEAGDSGGGAALPAARGSSPPRGERTAWSVLECGDSDTEDEELDRKRMRELEQRLAEQRKMIRQAAPSPQAQRPGDQEREVVSAADLRRIRDARTHEIFQSLQRHAATRAKASKDLTDWYQPRRARRGHSDWSDDEFDSSDSEPNDEDDDKGGDGMRRRDDLRERRGTNSQGVDYSEDKSKDSLGQKRDWSEPVSTLESKSDTKRIQTVDPRTQQHSHQVRQESTSSSSHPNCPKTSATESAVDLAKAATEDFFKKLAELNNQG